jgi:hypothetical protein
MNKWLERLLWFFISCPNEHLSDESMANLFCGELPLFRRLGVRCHIASCVDCRRRYEELLGPRAQRVLQIYRESLECEGLRLTPGPRAAFARWLQLQIPHQPQRQIPAPRFASAFPAVMAGVVIGILTALSGAAIWWWQFMPNITANTLLVRAESWDVASQALRPGVVRQTVQIRTSGQTIRRPVYWDLQGRRQPRQEALSPTEEQLRSKLRQAGVSWDQPISASAYQFWHDHQHVRTDHIVRSGEHLLTLTTTVPSGVVSEESLTVRDTDFHPVTRKVGFRDSDTVEIAELEYEVLPWNAVRGDVFEPVADTTGSALESAARVPLHTPVPALPSPEQLDETELAARLVLDQLHADSGEQVEIHRSAQLVEVVGLVETDERKRELTAGLLTVPRLKVSIQSAAHLLKDSTLADEAVLAPETSLPDRPSALAAYMQTRGGSLSDINALAERIFSAALSVSQESHAIDDLETHFSSAAHMPILTRATLEDLLYNHRARLEVALRQERLLLTATQDIPAPEDGSAKAAGISLKDEASRNLVLSTELTQTNLPVERDARVIVTEMMSTIDRITVALDTSGDSRNDSIQNKREQGLRSCSAPSHDCR